MPFTGHVRKRNTKSGITTYQIIVEKESDTKTGKRERYYKTIKGSKKDAERAMRTLDLFGNLKGYAENYK